MFWKSKSSIGNKSNGNVVMQNSTLNNNVMVIGLGSEPLKVLAQVGEYEAIQTLISTQLSAVSKMHPLYPDFSAKIDSRLNRLVSTPETDEAFKNHPKIIKGTYEMNLKKYPHYNKSETPWEYAYRTQTEVELKTMSHQEYLGDIEDPFPEIKYTEGMVTVISPPVFPAAIEAYITSGDVVIPFHLRRFPCFEYGKLLFSNESSGHGFDLNITYDDQMTFKITKTFVQRLDAQLLREKLIHNIYTSKNLSIFIEDKELINAKFKDSVLTADMFKKAPFMIKYIESLLDIERKLNCHFDPEIKDVSYDDYITALIMSSSLENKWHLIRAKFDNELYYDYEGIPDAILETVDSAAELNAEIKILSFSLQGLNFSADKKIIYSDAKINNVESVRKNIKRKRKNILITIKPQEGKDFFNKYMYMEDISLIS